MIFIKIRLGSSTGTINEVDLFSVKTLADPPRIYKQLVVEGKALFRCKLGSITSRCTGK